MTNKSQLSEIVNFLTIIGETQLLTQKKRLDTPVSSLLTGAGGRTRTGTVSPPVDFESTTSANSITPAIKIDLCIIQ